MKPYTESYLLGVFSGVILTLSVSFVTAACSRVVRSLDYNQTSAAKNVLKVTEDEKVVAFVDGTGEYSIRYMQKTRTALTKQLSEQELAQFDAAIAEVTLLYTSLADRITELHSSGNYLREDDSMLLKYREAHNKATNIMLDLFRKLGERADAEVEPRLQ